MGEEGRRGKRQKRKKAGTYWEHTGLGGVAGMSETREISGLEGPFMTEVHKGLDRLV